MPIDVIASSDPRDWTRVAEDLLMPELVTVRAYDMTDYPYDVEVDVIPGDRGLVVREVRVRQRADGASVTSEGIRAVPVARLAKWAAKKVQRVVSHDGQTLVTQDAGITDAEVDYVREHGLTGRTLEIVARTYRMAMLMGNPPTKTVEEWLEVPRSTAGRWVAAARESGDLLPADGPGRKG